MSGTPDSSDPACHPVVPAVPDDADGLRIIAQLSGIDAWTAEQYREEIRREDATVLVARAGGQVIGFVSGRLVPGAVEGLEGEIYNIAVAPESRRRRVGGALLSGALRFFSSRACSAVWLEVREENGPAIQFYENNGFTPISVRRNFYSGPVDNAVLMKRLLGPRQDAGEQAKA